MTSNDTIPIPEQLRRPHRLVASTRDAAIGLRPLDDGRLRVGPAPGIFHLVVSRQLLPRALRIVQAICTESERRDWEVRAFEDPLRHQRPGASINIARHVYPIEVHEQTDTLPFTDEEIAEWRQRWRGDPSALPPPQLKRRQATGRLTLTLPSISDGRRTRWSDGPRGLIDGKLGSLFPALEARVETDERRAEEFAHHREESERRQKRARTEKARTERLEREVEAWQRSERIRGYLAALRDRLSTLQPTDRGRIEAWCSWIEARATRTDPTRNPSQIVGLDDPKDQF